MATVAVTAATAVSQLRQHSDPQNEAVPTAPADRTGKSQEPPTSIRSSFGTRRAGLDVRRYRRRTAYLQVAVVLALLVIVAASMLVPA